MSAKHGVPSGAATGFVDNIPGMKARLVAHAEVSKRTRDAQRKSPDTWKEYNALARTIRVINRAELGPCTGKAYLGCYNGDLWPDESDGNDEGTWLQPGTYMDVPKDVALHLVGNVWDPTLPDKNSVISRYGGPKFKPPPGGAVSGRGAPMEIIGPPDLPDLIVVEINSRGRMAPDFKYVYELYVTGLVGSTVAIGEEAVAEEPEAVTASV